VKRIAVGGFQHETNTFSHTRADLEDFLAADAWPALAKGAEMTRAVAGMNLPISGFSEEALSLGYEIVPLLWCSATPSGPVTEDAFESIWAMIAEELGEESLDGVYLDLHGAMVAELFDDGEGEILRRVRNIVGDKAPIVASLDLHANVSPAMVEESSVLLAYRTYPHVDMAETGRRAARVMDVLLSSPHEPHHKSFSELPFLIPIPWQCTLIEPMSSLVTYAEKLEKKKGILSLSLTTGFPLADIPDCGPAVMAYGTDDASVDHEDGLRQGGRLPGPSLHA
jgi:microcystin degradation protein MlrC